MRAPSWRRGFFRLWVLLSGFWLLGLLALNMAEGGISQKWEEYQKADAWERMIVRIETGIREGGMTDNNGQFVEISKLQSDLAAVKEAQPRVIEQSDQAMEWFQNLAMFLIGPPVALLVIGYAFLWVADGFRPRDHNSSQ